MFLYIINHQNFWDFLLSFWCASMHVVWFLNVNHFLPVDTLAEVQVLLPLRYPMELEQVLQ